jgi:nucleoside-diphosphate-sugar epimerase
MGHILVTGSSGFLGSVMLANLLKRKNKISTVVRSKQKINSSINEIVIGGISSENNWKSHLAGVDVIIHLAAVAHNNSNDPDYINEVNVNGTINLAQQAATIGVKRFVFISSIGVLGNSTTNILPFDEYSNVLAHSQYSQSKLDAENALFKIAEETELEVVIIRPVLVYGLSAPGNFGKLVNLVNKVPMLPFALCKNKRSFISVDNLVDFISVCIDHPKAKNEIFCISDGHDVSIREFTDGIAKGLNKRLIQLSIPVFIIKLLGKMTGKNEPVDQLIGDLQVDSTKARELLGWRPPLTMTETLSKLRVKN